MKEIYYFTAGWCQPCKILAPLMDELSGTYSIKLGQTFPIKKIDIDQNKDLAIKNNVQGVPTVIIFEDGVEKQRIVGLRTKNEYINVFEN